MEDKVKQQLIDHFVASKKSDYKSYLYAPIYSYYHNLIVSMYNNGSNVQGIILEIQKDLNFQIVDSARIKARDPAYRSMVSYLKKSGVKKSEPRKNPKPVPERINGQEYPRLDKHVPKDTKEEANEFTEELIEEKLEKGKLKEKEDKNPFTNNNESALSQ